MRGKQAQEACGKKASYVDVVCAGDERAVKKMQRTSLLRGVRVGDLRLDIV